MLQKFQRHHKWCLSLLYKNVFLSYGAILLTAYLGCISPDGRLDESLRDASADGEETLMRKDTLKGYAEGVE